MFYCNIQFFPFYGVFCFNADIDDRIRKFQHFKNDLMGFIAERVAGNDVFQSGNRDYVACCGRINPFIFICKNFHKILYSFSFFCPWIK